MVEETKHQTIKERIEREFGTINKFVDIHYTELGVSRSYLYSLINNEVCNPTIAIMIRLANLTKIPLEDIVYEYSVRYRNKQSSSQYTD